MACKDFLKFPSDIPGEEICISKKLFNKATKKVNITNLYSCNGKLVIKYTTKAGKGTMCFNNQRQIKNQMGGTK